MRKLELKHVIPPNIAPKSTVDRILTINGMMPVKLEHICADAIDTFYTILENYYSTVVEPQN